MENKEEEEDEMALLDYRSPKGQLIKLLEQKMKKPEIDDSLGKVLDQFSQMTREQMTFLDNGVFHMNFAEDALLLQACGQYYGKRVDKLWNEMLEFHTGLVKHDDHAAKHCINQKERDARKTEVSKLEERLNRGKRKKIRLVEPDEENEDVEGDGEYFIEATARDSRDIFGDPSFKFFGEEKISPPARVPFKCLSQIHSEWRKLNLENEREAKKNFRSLFVSHFHHLRYRFKHYHIPSRREMIYDANDPEEFNTREGRLISCHYIRHLFDDNDRCLIPDENYLIARLRLSYVLRKKFLLSNKIRPDEPYQNYRDIWEAYLKKFLERENRKIQNMPQGTDDQLITFCKALARKEELAYEKVEELKAQGVKDLPFVSFENVIVEPAKEGYEGVFDPYIPDEFYTPKPVNLLDLYGGIECYPDDESNAEYNLMMKDMMSSDHENHNEENTQNDPEAEISSLLENMPDNPDRSHVDALTGRADSGYFDGGFADEDESVCNDRLEAPAVGTDTSFEFGKDSSANKESEADEVASVSGTAEPEISEQDHTSEENNIIDISQCIENEIEMGNDSSIEQFKPSGEMNKKIKEFSMNASEDHQESINKTLENCYFDDSQDVITIVYNKQDIAEENPANVKTPRTIKRKMEVEENVAVKKRRLSQKIVGQLKQSVVPTVKESKWEYFYSLNYQPEDGEGEMLHLDWEENVDEGDDLLEDNDEDCTDETDVNNETMDDNCEENQIECPEATSQLTRKSDSGFETLGDQTTEADTSAINTEENNKATKTTSTSEPSLFESLQKRLDEFGERLEGVELEEPDNTSNMTPREKEMYESRKRVAEWRAFITPKLRQLNDEDFDIHEYGSRIMNDMEINESRPFSDFVDGKPSSEVVRYFVSSLQLANTMNVEILGAKPGELSNDTLELKLLSKDRYHEHLQEFQAPSEEGLKEKLLKIKQIRQQNKMLKRKSDSKTANEAKQSKSAKSVKKPRVSRSKQVQNSDPQEPCSSRQADERDRNNSINAYLDDWTQTTNRTSNYSGCMPACDDEFLEQFDQLQSISEEEIQSESDPNM